LKLIQINPAKPGRNTVSSIDKDSDKDNDRVVDSEPMPLPWKERTRAKHLGDLVPGILEPVIARRSGMTHDLIAGWEDIVGPNYAMVSRPEKILWPKQAGDDDPFQPGTLVVACDGSKALFFQHEMDQTIERLNHFFGFQAIAKIRINQKPVAVPVRKAKSAPDLSANERQRLEKVIAQITDPELKKRVAAFGEGVIARQRGQKSG